jgi:hypothetical protein
MSCDLIGIINFLHQLGPYSIPALSGYLVCSGLSVFGLWGFDSGSRGKNFLWVTIFLGVSLSGHNSRVGLYLLNTKFTMRSNLSSPCLRRAKKKRVNGESRHAKIQGQHVSLVFLNYKVLHVSLSYPEI